MVFAQELITNFNVGKTRTILSVDVQYSFLP